MSPPRSQSRRALLRFLSRRRGPLRAVADLRYVTEVLRFSVLFAALVLVPVILLAMLALSSLQAEELQADAGLRQRAEAIATQVQEGLRTRFQDFEVEVLARLDSGDTELASLQAPGLRAVFRFDADGKLVSPFAMPGPNDTWPAPPAAFDRAWRTARELEAEGRIEAALDAYADAAVVATSAVHAAEAGFARARLLARTGGPGAEEALVYAADALPSARDRRGVRIADGVALLRAELALDRGDEATATTLLRGVVDRALAALWIVGLPADAFLAELALERLEGRMDANARRLAAVRLKERLDQLYWATHVADELRLVAARGRSERRFEYLPEERALWLVVRTGDATYAFSFDQDAVQLDLARKVVDVASRVDPELTASLVGVRDELGDAFARRSLAPELPRVAVNVAPVDPKALADQRRRTRAMRALVVVLAVLSAALGMVASVRTVNRELDSARQRADFAANVSHELRSPITQIRLKGESLQLDLVYDDDDRRAHYDAIVREAERLSRLVDNVLDFAAIERGVKRYSLRPDDLTDIVLKAVENARAPAASANMQLAVDVPEDLPVVWVDRDAIGQVMTNLLSNAIKYGGPGDRVEVVARVGLDGLDVSVTDHGIGIAPEDQAKVFEHFYRVSSADVRKRRGTGIGLTIVRYIVEAHGGTITVESTLGRGSTFTVTLPLEPPEDAGV